MLQEHIAGRLLRIDANAVVGDDGTRCRRDLELFGGELEDGRKRSGLRDAKPGTRQYVLDFHSDLRNVSFMLMMQLLEINRRWSPEPTYTLNGSLGSEVSVILKVTFDLWDKGKK